MASHDPPSLTAGMMSDKEGTVRLARKESFIKLSIGCVNSHPEVQNIHNSTLGFMGVVMGLGLAADEPSR